MEKGLLHGKHLATGLPVLLRSRANALVSVRRGAERNAGRKTAGVDRQLVVTAGQLAGTRITLSEAPITIGRAEDSTLVITDDFASARHARLVPRDGNWFVEDLGSTNGTYHDRGKVSGPTPVPLGVPIRIGRTSLELRP